MSGLCTGTGPGLTERASNSANRPATRGEHLLRTPFPTAGRGVRGWGAGAVQDERCPRGAAEPWPQAREPRARRPPL
eukprot:3687011-Rhodomonas_salina.4